MQANAVRKMTEEEYLALERVADFKSEFVGGEMFAMAGGKLRHADLGARVIVEFARKLGASCRTFNSDARVRTAKSKAYLYPDVSVVCGPVERDQEDILLNPVVIVEVLSPSTADYDHGSKFAMCREIPSFREYIMVHTEKLLIEHYTKIDDGRWLLSEHEGMDGEIDLPAVSCQLSLRNIYDGAIE